MIKIILGIVRESDDEKGWQTERVKESDLVLIQISFRRVKLSSESEVWLRFDHLQASARDKL